MCAQVGAQGRPHGPCVLCGSHHQDHHMAAPHAGIGAQLWGVAAPAQPAAGSHAAVQPEIHLWGEKRRTLKNQKPKLKKLRCWTILFRPCVCVFCFSFSSKTNWRLRPTKSLIQWALCHLAGVNTSHFLEHEFLMSSSLIAIYFEMYFSFSFFFFFVTDYLKKKNHLPVLLLRPLVSL